MWQESLSISFKSLFIFVIFLVPLQLQAQDTGNDYYSENKYPDYPLITLRENFLGNPVYLIDGKKVRVSDVRAYMEIMPGDANEFAQTHTKALTGLGMNIAGQLVLFGSLGYVYSNMDNLNRDIVRNWLLMTVGGSLLNISGRGMNRQGVRKINSLIENHNYLIRQDELRSPYLRMDFRQNLLGEKIDIYDGPKLLGKNELKIYKEEFPELEQYLQRAQRNQNWSMALDILSLATSLTTLLYISSPQIQSATPSNLLIPLTVANFGLSISSTSVRRAARNQTRIALMKFNFRDEYETY